jgi:hypothetical protein
VAGSLCCLETILRTELRAQNRSQWLRADHSRSDAFGWWNEVHDAPPEAMPEIPFPFELHFRLLLKDHLYVD